MNILIIPDKFKGSLSGAEVIAAIAEGIRAVDDHIKVHHIIASDGGDGFLHSIENNHPCLDSIACQTTDPLGREIQSKYLFDAQANCAYVEMAKASGMELLSAAERNPMLTSTRGTGVLIADAIARGAETIFVGLGGSATNDGGVGIAAALGYRFIDPQGTEIDPVGGQLQQIASIDASGRLPALDHVRVVAINDVANPLLGDEGAAAVYAPQKGADEDMVAQLELGLANLDQVVQRDLGIAAADVAGAGAAGGTGYGLKVFLQAEYQSGIEFVLSLTGTERLLAGGAVDLIITGEGRIDDQTAYGKLVHGVSVVGEKYGVPVAAVCGQLAMQQKTIHDLGLRRVIQIHDPERDLEFTIQNAKSLLVDAASQLIRPFQSSQ
ncbi:glycerate kinase [Stieleria sp. TO1_6]|uniref:glycerate kinase n=1 Tax=Stieleria tagensis TaxID=2956795 RepID=UPI00209B9FE9|nr:glycerate kinase [Stieleria tagensis]MCO8121358.1 glycerate kinase [Stieleria tagensis]